MNFCVFIFKPSCLLWDEWMNESLFNCRSQRIGPRVEFRFIKNICALFLIFKNVFRLVSHAAHFTSALKWYKVYFYAFFQFHACKCVLSSEWCWNAGDLHSVLCLNASRVDTDGGVKLLLLRRHSLSRFLCCSPLSQKPVLSRWRTVWMDAWLPGCVGVRPVHRSACGWQYGVIVSSFPGVSQ